MYLHKRLQQNQMTSQYCYGEIRSFLGCFNLVFRITLDIDDVYRVLPQGMDHMNPDIIRRRKCILEQYIQV